jgi:hypothetical protein
MEIIRIDKLQNHFFTKIIGTIIVAIAFLTIKMKNCTLILFLFLTTFGFSQKAQFTIYVPIDVPEKKVMTEMQTSAGIGFSFAYKPVFGLPMLAEFKTSFGTYATQNYSNDVPLYEGYSATKVHSSYNNRFNKYLLGTKWFIGYDFRTIRAFITPQIGLANFRTATSINFNAPNGKDNQFHKVAQRNMNPVFGIEIGTEIILNNVFKSIKGNYKHRIQLSASFLRGFNSFSYTNVNDMFDANTVTNDQLKENTTYINLPNDYVYENYYTELYKTKLSMWGINIGYVINISGDEE